VSIRIALGPGERPATLFVISDADRFYTYWLHHWHKRYRRVCARYESELRKVFNGRNVIAPQGARRNIVGLREVSAQFPIVKRIVLRAVEGIRSINAADTADRPESLVGLEGEVRRRMVLHRTREGRLRDARISLIQEQTGALACEVTGCGFDFYKAYGELGENYAQVHHIRPLSERNGVSKTRVSDLRVVCANCHAMIHLGGKSRSLSQIARALGRVRRRGASA
jgi:5-methylcytosine-specific restriction endonuclease McrA